MAAVLLGRFTGNRLLELRHDFHDEGGFVLEERDAGGVRGEGSEFVAQQIHSKLLLLGSIMVSALCTVYQLLYFVQATAALGVAEQARAGDVVSGEGFPVNPAEFAALEEVEFRVEDDVYQHFLHLRDGDAFAGRAGILCSGALGGGVRGPGRVSLTSWERSVQEG